MTIGAVIQRSALCAGLVMTVACGGGEAPPAETPAEPAAAPVEAPAAPAGPRVYFVEPMDGATVSSPVHLVFGIENYEVSPVPQGTIEAARAGMGHHHVAADTDCLAPGTPVPMARPWTHFGAGQTEMELPLQPGPHRLTLQLGNDMHQAVEGMCTTINITVSE